MVLLTRPGRRTRAVCAAALISFSIWSCGESPSGPEDVTSLSCSELTSRFFKDSSDQGHYRVVSPNGGESHKAGDSLIVILASGVNDGEALVQLDVRVGGVSRRGVLPGFPNKAVDSRTQCRLGFRIPDSLTVSSGRIALVSDSVRIRVAWYGHEDFQDYSDGYFRIGK
jgi:hypothetical protein